MLDSYHENIRNQKKFITGGTSGIGKATAMAFS